MKQIHERILNSISAQVCRVAGVHYLVLMSTQPSSGCMKRARGAHDANSDEGVEELHLAGSLFYRGMLLTGCGTLIIITAIDSPRRFCLVSFSRLVACVTVDLEVRGRQGASARQPACHPQALEKRMRTFLIFVAFEQNALRPRMDGGEYLLRTSRQPAGWRLRHCCASHTSATVKHEGSKLDRQKASFMIS